mgnify:CR=1 FL=1
MKTEHRRKNVVTHTINSINSISLFSGYGGLTAGLSAVIPIKPALSVEREVSVAAIMASRFADGTAPSPLGGIWSDITTFDPAPWRGRIDLVEGSPPCVSHSQAGLQRGGADPREMSSEFVRVVEGVDPSAIFVENVVNYKRFWFDNVRPRLQELGYEIKEGLFSAEEVGAPHKRDRFFALGFKADRVFTGSPFDPTQFVPDWRVPGFVADDNDEHLHSQQWIHGAEPDRASEELAIPVLSGVGRPGREAGGRTGFTSVRPGDGEKRTVRPEATGSDELADHPKHGVQESRPANQEERNDTAPAPIGNGPELADRECIGTQGEAPGKQSTEQGINYDGPEGLPLFPPRPGDIDGWSRLLSRMPEVEPSFCSDAHGRRSWVGQSLRAIGNAVVPLVASVAYWELATMFIDSERREEGQL